MFWTRIDHFRENICIEQHQNHAQRCKVKEQSMLQRNLALSDTKVALSATWSYNVGTEQWFIKLSGGLTESLFHVLTDIALSNGDITLSGDNAYMLKWGI